MLDPLLVNKAGKFLEAESLVNGETRAIVEASVAIGFDPASRATGWAVLAVAGDIERVIGVGVYNAQGADLLGRLVGIEAFAYELAREWSPDLVAVEAIFHGLNAKTTIALAQVGAAVRLGAYRAGSPPILDVSPSERAVAVGLSGSASKGEIGRAVRSIYEIEVFDHNSTDAIAIAAAAAAELRREAAGLSV